MSDRQINRLRWHLDEEGQGTVYIDVLDERGRIQSGKRVIDSLDELSGEVAEVIREDGRLKGEWPEEKG